MAKTRSSGAGRTGGPRKATGARKSGAVRGASRTGKTGATAPRTPPRLPKAVVAAVSAGREKKADDIVVLDLRKTGGFTDYFVIFTGGNARQIAAIADSVRDTLKDTLGERPALAEGVDRSEWVLLDYFNFVVHVFSRECRAFYGLERLWGNAERYEFPNETP
jgi:ribosome-associated protein